MGPYQLALLFDENLSPGPVKLAAKRGFKAVHINSTHLMTRDDKSIARYAIGRGMILATRNVVDFEKIYSRRELPPHD